MKNNNNKDVKQAMANIDNKKAMFTKDELASMETDTAKGRNGGIDTISINNKDSFTTTRNASGSKQVKHLLRIIAKLCANSSTGVISYQDFCDAWEDEDRCGYTQSVPECFTHYFTGGGATKNLVRTTKLDLATLNDALVFNS